MTEPPRKSRSLWWALAGGVTGLIVAVLAGGAWYWLAGQKVWVDGRGLALPDEAVRPRQVLWAKPQPLTELNTPEQEYEPAAAPDGDELYFVRGLPGQDADIYVSRQRDGAWDKPVRLEINTESDELGPRLSPDGRWLFFYSDRPGGLGEYDIWAAPRSADGWGQPVNLGSSVNTEHDEYGPAVGPDGRLYFASNRKAAAGRKGPAWRATIRQGRAGDYDLFVCGSTGVPPATPLSPRERVAEGRVRGDVETALSGPSGHLPLRGRGSRDAGGTVAAATETPVIPAYTPAVELAGVNTPHHEGACCVSPEGDFLYFASDRPGGLGGFDIYRCRLRDGVCQAPENLGIEVNTSANEADPQLAMGGFLLYFSSDAAGGYDLMVSQSREVYAQRQDRPRPQVAWVWWTLLGTVAVLLPLLLFLHAGGYRHLQLLQKCLVVSLLAHLVIIALMSTAYLSLEVAQFVAREAGMTVAVNLELAREIEVGMDVRQQLTQLPVPEPAATDLARIEQPEPPRVAPEQPPIFVPQVRHAPAAMTEPPEAPPLKPADAPREFELPPPPLEADQPQLALVKDRPPWRPPEPPPRTGSAPPPLEQVRLEPQPPKPAELPAPPLRQVQTPPESKVHEPELRPDQPLLAERPVPAALPELPRAEPSAREMPQPVIQAEPESDVPEPRLQVAQRQAPAMTVSTAPAELAEPAVAPVAQAVRAAPLEALEAATRPAPATERPAPPLPELAKLDIARPQQPQAEPSARPPEPPAAALESPLKLSRVPTAGPGAQPSLAVAAMPSSSPTPRSLAVAVPADASTPRPAPPVAISLNFSPQAVEVKLPAMASAAAAQPERSPPGVQMPLVALARQNPSPAPTAPPVELARAPAVAPVQAGAVSLAHLSLSSVARPRQADAVGERASPQPVIAPLAGSLGPGRLTSPEALAQRSFEQRQRLLNELGGSEASEAAVGRALVYLARNQQPDGRWRHDGAQQGRHDAAVTGLASLCFLASDHTPGREGPYREHVRKGVDFLLTQQKSDGDFRGGGDMYAQAIVTLAVAEAALMTGDDRYRQAAIKGAEFILRAQNPTTGGWRYLPGDPGDTSVFGWQVMALKSVEKLGVKIPPRNVQLCRKWLDSVTNSPHKMISGYQNPTPRPSMTAEAVFSRLMLGDTLTYAQQKEACDYILAQQSGAGKGDFYFIYYGSLAMMQLQNDSWSRWNGFMREHLVKLQKAAGEQSGSWDPTGKYDVRGGRVYVTSLATLSLEVYYRYLPMYGRQK